MFGAPVGIFNFEGRTHVHSIPGLVCSLVLYIVITSYAIVKFSKVMQGTGYVLMNSVPNPEGVNLEEANF
jgi:hypothetical protein